MWKPCYKEKEVYGRKTTPIRTNSVSLVFFIHFPLHFPPIFLLFSHIPPSEIYLFSLPFELFLSSLKKLQFFLFFFYLKKLKQNLFNIFRRVGPREGEVQVYHRRFGPDFLRTFGILELYQRYCYYYLSLLGCTWETTAFSLPLNVLLHFFYSPSPCY